MKFIQIIREIFNRNLPISNRSTNSYVNQKNGGIQTIIQQNDLNVSKEEIVGIGEKKYSICSDDNYLEHIKNGFEPETVDLFKVLASNSNIALDVGANIGCTALLLGGLSKITYAFEPSPTTYSFLARNISKSGLNNIIPLNIGLGDEKGEFPLAFSPSDRSGGFVSNQTRASSEHTVEKIAIYQLDEITKSLNLQNVDFIKIDVEGFEEHVLRGATQTLNKFQPVVVLELNHWCLNAFQKTSVPDFFDFLRSLFPSILLAVDGRNYQDLHDPDESYVVMYYHILNMKFTTIVAAFDENRLTKFRTEYYHQFINE